MIRPSSGTPGVETAPVLSSSSVAVFCVSAERSARTEAGGDEVMTITCLVMVMVAPATVPARSDIPYFRPPCGCDDTTILRCDSSPLRWYPQTQLQLTE